MKLLERLAVIAGDLLVPLGQGAQFHLADHRLDAIERPVAGALVDLAQDGVGGLRRFSSTTLDVGARRSPS